MIDINEAWSLRAGHLWKDMAKMFSRNVQCRSCFFLQRKVDGWIEVDKNKVNKRWTRRPAERPDKHTSQHGPIILYCSEAITRFEAEDQISGWRHPAFSMSKYQDGHAYLLLRPSRVVCTNTRRSITLLFWYQILSSWHQIVMFTKTAKYVGKISIAVMVSDTKGVKFIKATVLMQSHVVRLNRFWQLTRWFHRSSHAVSQWLTICVFDCSIQFWPGGRGQGEGRQGWRIHCQARRKDWTWRRWGLQSLHQSLAEDSAVTQGVLWLVSLTGIKATRDTILTHSMNPAANSSVWDGLSRLPYHHAGPSTMIMPDTLGMNW